MSSPLRGLEKPVNLRVGGKGILCGKGIILPCCHSGNTGTDLAHLALDKPADPAQFMAIRAALGSRLATEKKHLKCALTLL